MVYRREAPGALPQTPPHPHLLDAIGSRFFSGFPRGFQGLETRGWFIASPLERLGLRVAEALAASLPEPDAFCGRFLPPLRSWLLPAPERPLNKAHEPRIAQMLGFLPHRPRHRQIEEPPRVRGKNVRCQQGPAPRKQPTGVEMHHGHVHKLPFRHRQWCGHEIHHRLHDTPQFRSPMGFCPKLTVLLRLAQQRRNPPRSRVTVQTARRKADPSDDSGALRQAEPVLLDPRQDRSHPAVIPRWSLSPTSAGSRRRGNVRSGLHQHPARDPDNPFPGPTPGSLGQSLGGLRRDIGPDHGKVTILKFPDFRARVATGAPGGIRSRTKTTCEHKL